ncbi:amino acid adenylation domain-containing protein [Streptomyces sp. NPDC014894]|uniref:non-ribosomal peptide synthetase n=1 Tax=Streptomyces sp. NPDC014894 TaxID=3364931 RepID=UPI0036F9C354
MTETDLSGPPPGGLTDGAPPGGGRTPGGGQTPGDRQASREFPLTDIQSAYIVGESRMVELGGRQQYYIELDAVGLDPARGEEALNALVHRHETLRTVMLAEGRGRVMEPAQLPRVPLPVADLTGLGPAERDAAVAGVRERMCTEGLDPTGWPLFEVVASRIRRHRYRLHFRYSLILVDAPSLNTVVDEWLELYHDLAAPLPPVAKTFREWRTELLADERGEGFAKQWAYWEKRLDTLPEAPRLPLVREPRSIESVLFTARTARLGRKEWETFCANFRKHRVLPATALMHVLCETLAAWASAPHFCLNVVHLQLVARRPGPPVVGQRTATLPLEVDHRGAAGFWERAKRLQKQMWSDMSRSDVTGVRISRELAARSGWSQRAAFPYVFTSNQGPGWDTPPPRSRPAFRAVERIQHTPQVLLDNQIRDLPGGGVASNIDFVEEAFPPGMPELFAASYQRLLTALSRPDGAEGEPDPVPAAHRALIESVNDTGRPVPAGRLEDRPLRRAAERPGDPAVITDGRTLTYGELEARSRAVAHWLLERGVRRGDTVPVVMVKGWEQVVAVLGALRAGAAYVPVDALMPKGPMGDLLDECSARVVLAQSHALPDPGGARQPPEVLEVDGAGVSDEPLPPVEGGARDLAYIVYTSGSTGRPKGVMIEHRSALNTVVDVNERVRLGSGDRVFGISSLAFDLSVWDVFGALSAGAAVVLPDPTPLPDPVAWTATAQRHGVTVWNSVPALAEMLVEVTEERPGLGRPPIRAFLLSGDWVPTALPDRTRALWSGVRVIAMGGATEASIWSNVYEVGETDPAWRSVPYGKPLTNQTMRVLDHRLDVRQPWAVGHIHIGGVGLARGYWRDEERTAERFIVHPRTGERLYRTGDLGRYRPDGTIEFMGREDRQVKILGYRVEPGSVEAALRSHPGVRACVVCVDDAPGGQRRLVALVVPEAGSGLDGAGVGEHLRRHLPHYMIPGHTQIVDQLPLTANGKVDAVRALRMVSAPRADAVAVGDEDPLVRKLAELWTELLEVPSVGPESNFFALGGNSLLALRMVNRVHAEFGADLPLGRVFEAPTVREFAAGLAREGRSAERPSCAVRLSEGEGPGLTLFHVMGGSVAPYVPLARSWPGPVHGFQSRPHVDRSETAFAPDLETMAAGYREELLRLRPTGPYILGGWSMGGFLAYEIACQLRELGRSSYVFMLDSRITDLRVADSEPERHLAFIVTLCLGPPPPVVAAAVRSARPAELSRVARDTCVAHGLLPPEVDVAGYERLLRIQRHETRLTAAWRPRPHDGPTLLYVADREPLPDPEPVWRAVCPGLAVERRATDHAGIGKPASQESIAAHLAAWLPSAP